MTNTTIPACTLSAFSHKMTVSSARGSISTTYRCQDCYRYTETKDGDFRDLPNVYYVPTPKVA